MPRRSAAVAGLLATALLTITACQGNVPTQSPSRAPSPAGPSSTRPPAAIDLTATSYRAEAGRDGGSVVIGGWQEASQFNPYYLGAGTEPAVASAAWATLVRLSHDHRYVADLASVVPTVDNGGVAAPGEGNDAMTVHWTLREGLKWSDGEALTCDDFKYAWEWVLDDDNFGVVTAGFEDIKDVACRSDTEMVWHLERVYEGYLGLMRAPLPRHHLEAIPMQEQTQGVGFRPADLARLPVSGPFRFESVAPTAALLMARNPTYAGAATGKPAHLEALSFRWYPDVEALIAGYRAGEVSIATGLTDDDLAALGDLAGQALTQPSLTYETLRPNWSSEACAVGPAVRNRGPGCPLADPAVRRAVASAIDRRAIIGRVIGDATAPLLSTNVNQEAWFHVPQAALPFDPAAARQVLDEAGWVDTDGDGIREKDGLEARIEICTTARQARLDMVALAAAGLREVGIDAVPREADPDDMFATYERADRRTPCALRQGNFDLALHSLTASSDPLDYYFHYHSSQFEPDGQNDAQVNAVGIDVALETVKSTASPAVIKDAMGEYQKVFVEETVELPIHLQRTIDLPAANLGNVVGSSPVGGLTWNVADWFVKG